MSRNLLLAIAVPTLFVVTGCSGAGSAEDPTTSADAIGAESINLKDYSLTTGIVATGADAQKLYQAMKKSGGAKDIGEGLNTVVEKMREARLQQPDFRIEGNAFVVRLGHTPLARPEEIVMEYLDNNPEITNRQARELCGISSENKMKDVFLALARADRIERVPGKGGGSSAWQKLRRTTKDGGRT